jgi:antitoxin component of RelBE/YafQ-DinJ toxin-antitoxin module
MVSVRLDAERFDALATLAAREGLAPTAMARMLLHRAIRETERETQYLA